MKQPNFNPPPKWMDHLLSLYCRPELLEDLQGDLYEFYLRNAAEKGILKAQLIYLIDVLKFIRLYTVKTPKIFRNMNFIAIFKNNFKTSIRSLFNNKLFTGINVFGLAVSMSVGLLLITLYLELSKFDTFHENSSRIYRVINTLEGKEKDVTNFASTSVLLGDKIREEFTGVSKVVTFSGRYDIDAKYNDRTVLIKGRWATPEFEDVFSFKILKGSISKTLREPNQVVITRETSMKLFNTINVIGEIIQDGKGNSLTVGGIIEDIPKHSHLQFEALHSFVTLENRSKDKWFKEWKNMWSNHVYVLLHDEVPAKQFQIQLDSLCSRQNKISKGRRIQAKAQPLEAILPGPELSNEIGNSFDEEKLLILIGLAVVILISACFNYTNLSIARSLRRSKEIGVRKTIGATQLQVFCQFLLEAIIVSFLALLLSILLFHLVRPFFLEILGTSGDIVDLTLELSTIGYFILFSFLVGVTVGFFPSYMMSKMKVDSIFRDAYSIKLFSKISLRKTLIVVQFSLSMIFIMSVIISFKQYKYALNRDLGYQTENVLNLELQGNSTEILASEFDKLPFVKDYSFSLMVPSVGSIYTEIVKNRITNDSLRAPYNVVSLSYLPLHGHEFISGRNFDESPLNVSKKARSIIVNESLLKKLNVGAAQEAIGKKMFIKEYDNTGKTLIIKDRESIIVGVIKDFHFGTTENEIGPFFFLNGNEANENRYYQANIKIENDNLNEALFEIEATWKKTDKVHQFRALFFDEEIARTYFFFKSIIEIMSLMAFIAISIAILGLLGMVVFTTETRLKEISIRKILGATEGNLLILLGKGFLILILIAAAISIPLTYYTFDNYILKDYVYKESITGLELISGVAVILVGGFLVVLTQTLSASRTNPSEMLRNE